MRIFITGIRGFIPSHLANYLKKRGHTVFGIDNNLHPSKNNLDPKINAFYGDVRYTEDIENSVKNADIVYHMAAQINVDKSIAYPQETMDINLGGTTNVLNACRRYNKIMVFSSTSEIYGSHDEPINENSPTYAQSPYAVSKLSADKLCGNYHNLYGLEVYRFRGFNTYGPYQSNDLYGAVIPKFIKEIRNGRRPIIFGDGSQSRDYIYVDDVVRAYELIPQIKELNGEPINIGTGKTTSILEIANSLIKLYQRNGKPNIKPKHVKARSGEVYKLQADISLLTSVGPKEILPKIGIEEGLRRYVKWYESKNNYEPRRNSR